MGFGNGNSISWTICKQSAPRSRQITTLTPHHSIFTGRVLFLAPNQQCQSTEGRGKEEKKRSIKKTTNTTSEPFSNCTQIIWFSRQLFLHFVSKRNNYWGYAALVLFTDQMTLQSLNQQCKSIKAMDQTTENHLISSSTTKLHRKVALLSCSEVAVWCNHEWCLAYQQS